jgi:hypothetical protein
VRFAAGLGFCAVAEACGAVPELTFGLEAGAWVAVPVAFAALAVLAALVTFAVLMALAVLVAPEVALVALVAALAVAGFARAAADSVEPARLAAPAFPVLETLPAA